MTAAVKLENALKVKEGANRTVPKILLVSSSNLVGGFISFFVPTCNKNFSQICLSLKAQSI